MKPYFFLPVEQIKPNDVNIFLKHLEDPLKLINILYLFKGQ
jgi:hypothetical protein